MYQVLLFKFRRHLCKGSIQMVDCLVVVVLSKLMTLFYISPFRDSDFPKLLPRSPIQKSQEERERTAI